MKVLHLFSMAGVSELLAKEGDLVLQVKELDPFGFGLHYGNMEYHTDYLTVLERARQLEPEYDRIIIHDFNELLGEFPKEKSFIYFHGSKLRSLGRESITEVQSKCSGVFLSTSDLLDYIFGIVIPQPLDIEFFYERDLTREYDYLSIQRGYQFNEISNLIYKDFPQCEIRDRTKHILSYRSMPIFLNQIENYIDYKYDYSKPIPKPVIHYSLTGLQALACGCRVYTHGAEILSKTLLKEHDSKIIKEEFRKCLEH